MQQGSGECASAPGRDVHSVIGHKLKSDLLEEIRPVATAHCVGEDALVQAYGEAVNELDQNWDERLSQEERRTSLLGLILWKLFAGGSAPWIDSRTAEGNAVPIDVLVSAYEMWKRAVGFAERFRLDSATTAEALARAAHRTADQLARIGRGEVKYTIRNVGRYLFVAYMRAVFDATAKDGLPRTDFTELTDAEESDSGTFQQGLENSILCRELLDVMPPKAKSVVISRFIAGKGWAEIAAGLETTVNAAQKAQSVGFKRAFEICMGELRKERRPKMVSGMRMFNKRRSHSGGE